MNPKDGSSFDLLPGYEVLYEDLQVAIYAREFSLIKYDASWTENERAYSRHWNISSPDLTNFLYNVYSPDYFFIGEAGNRKEWYVLNSKRYPPGETVTVGNGRKLSDVLSFIFSDLFGFQVKSTLFFDDNDETGINYSDSGNYVHVQEMCSIHLHALSDVKRPNATEAASVLRFNAKDLLEDLSRMFGGVGFFTDTNGSVRLEHQAYFNLASISSVIGTVQLNSFKVLNESYQYDFEASKYELYEFVISESAENRAFVQNNNLPESDIEKTATRLIVTDIHGILKKPDSFSDANIFAFATESGAVITGTNDISGSQRINSYLDFSHLVPRYHQYNRPTTFFEVSIEQNSPEYSYNSSSSLRKKKTEKLTIRARQKAENQSYFSDYDALNNIFFIRPNYLNILTALGAAKIKEAELNLTTETYKIKTKC